MVILENLKSMLYSSPLEEELYMVRILCKMICSLEANLNGLMIDLHNL